MTLRELTDKLQTLCHEGHSLEEVVVDLDGNNERIVEIRRVLWIGKGRKISLVIGK